MGSEVPRDARLCAEDTQRALCTLTTSLPGAGYCCVPTWQRGGDVTCPGSIGVLEVDLTLDLPASEFCSH